ncbi:mitochondrial proton/calcium exchanger protein-like protein isoform X1, partial [Tanacetum coccineum]
MGHDIVQDSIWEHDDDSEEDQEEDGDDEDTFDMWDITVEDVERIRKFFNVPDEIDEIVQPLIPEPIHTTPPNDDYVAPATKSILDELLEEFGDEILNVATIDEEADPTKDLEELERLLAMRPQSNFMEIQIGTLHLLEAEAKSMAETMEQYMSKTRTDYGSGVVRPKIEEKDNMQEVILFYNGLDVSTRQILDSRGAIPTMTTADAKKVIREMSEYSQKWHNGTSRGRTQVGCEQCKGPHYTKDCPLKEEGGYSATAPGYYQRNNANPSYQERRQYMEDTLSKFMSESVKIHEENSYLIKEIRAMTDAAIRNQGASIKTLEIQIGQISKVLHERGFGSLPSSTKTNLRDQVKSISTTIEAISYLIHRIGSSQYAVSTGQTTIPFPSCLANHYYDEEEGNYGPKFAEAYGASHINDTIPRKEKDPGSFTLPCFINNTCFDNALVDLGASVSVMPLSTYLNLGLGELAHTRLTVELADRTVKYPKGIAENVLVGIGKFTFPVDFIILDMPEDIKVPLILGRPFLSTARAKIDVYKRKITLRVGEENIIFKSVKPASSLIKRVYMLSLRERMELDLEARLMGETLVLNRSLDPFLEDYIELNDLNEPFELRRNQGDDLMPTIKEGEVIEEFRTRDEDLDTEIDDYPSYCDDDKKI